MLALSIHTRLKSLKRWLLLLNGHENPRFVYNLKILVGTLSFDFGIYLKGGALLAPPFNVLIIIYLLSPTNLSIVSMWGLAMRIMSCALKYKKSPMNKIQVAI